MGSALRLPAGYGQGHLIIYRSGPDSRTNRANLALLRRIGRKSTTPLAIEVYYHENTRLADWADTHDGMRFIRLRSGEAFPVAERISSSASAAVIVLDDHLLLSAADVWLLIGQARSRALTSLNVSRAARERDERRSAFFLREARLRLWRYLMPQGDFSAHAFALNKSLLPVRSGSLSEKAAFSELLKEKTTNAPLIVRGSSVAVKPVAGAALLAAGLKSADAFLEWKRTKKFPWWFSARLPLFHVAQFAAYYAALVLLISPVSALCVFAFAIAITPQFFFSRARWLKYTQLPARFCARAVMYFIG